jgi:2-polyprenyl-6-methoxyphenol hydroxylase-like FAD-dependent oxidoreductase
MHRRRAGRPLLRDPDEKTGPAERRRRHRAQPPLRHVRLGRGLLDQTLGNLVSADEPTAGTILRAFNHWDDIDVFFKGRRITSGGHGFCGIGRKRLLNILQARCEELGVKLVFETSVTDERAVAQQYGADLVIASDGVNSGVRTRYSDVFRPRSTFGGAASSGSARRSASTRSRSRSRRRSTAGSRLTSISSTATRRPSSSRLPRRCGGAPGSTR